MKDKKVKVINVGKEIDSPSALTQVQGDIIYSIIDKALELDEYVKLDFSDVQSMITPFLNNAIGQLYGKY